MHHRTPTPNERRDKAIRQMFGLGSRKPRPQTEPRPQTKRRRKRAR